MSNKKTVAININLVPKDPFFESIFGRFLKWALSAGRYIVIFTELIVILSFVARFTLDRQVTDLNDQIYGKKTVIESYGQLESEVRITQKKIDDFRQLEQGDNLIDIFPQLTKIIPQGVTLQELNIRKDSVSLVGEASSQRTLNLLINNIQLSGDFYRTSVGKIESLGEKSQGYNFELKADTQENPVIIKKSK